MDAKHQIGGEKPKSGKKKKRKRRRRKKKVSKVEEQQNTHNAQQDSRKVSVAQFEEVMVPDNLHDFGNNVFMGHSVEELEAYLEKGGVDCSRWVQGATEELLEQINDSRCEVGLASDGTALRVATVAKVYAYDEANDCLLFNPLNSLEDSGGETVGLLERAFGGVGGTSGGSNETVGFASEAKDLEADGKKCVEIPGSLVFETTFSPFRETPRDAGVRLLKNRFNLNNVSVQVFSSTIPNTLTTYYSNEFAGLNSQYNIHHLKLSSKMIVPLQKTLPREEVTPIKPKHKTITGMNTNWYVWLKKSNKTSKDFIGELQDLYRKEDKLKEMIGGVDFRGKQASTLGNLLLEESGALNLWEDK